MKGLAMIDDKEMTITRETEKLYERLVAKYPGETAKIDIASTMVNAIAFKDYWLSRHGSGDIILTPIELGNTPDN